MPVLAADVGGTNCRLALIDPEGNVSRTRTHASQEHESLLPLLKAFVGDDAIEAAGIAVAGPVVDQRAELTNLTWSVDAAEIRTALGVPTCVMNDLAAIAAGVVELERHGRGLLSIREGFARPGPRLIVGVGTGLGKALELEGRVLSTEAGHSEWAPRNAREWALRQRWSSGGRTTVETILSGSGLGRVHAFVADREEALDGGEVAELARRGDEPARESLLWFCSLLGSELGNQALGVLPCRVYLAGGVPPKLYDQLGDTFIDRLVDAFDDKPPMHELLQATPITLVRDDDVGLLGAAASALR